jgi:hypothetical protein
VKKNKFFSIFFWTSELRISQAFCEHQARPIPTLYEPMANFCWKHVLSLFFMYFLRSSYMQPCGWNCPKAEGQGSQKNSLFCSWNLAFSLFFKFLFCAWFYMTSPSMWLLRSECEVFKFFPRIFSRSIVLKFGVKTPVNKNNSSSLIFTNLELKFEACMLNLFWKWGAKDPKIEKTI